MDNTNTPPKASQKDGLMNILFNIVIPVVILNKGDQYASALVVLMVALAFPLAFGSYDLIKNKKFNWFALLGIVNVSVTGGLALTGASGLWFAIKEAFFPFIIGVFVFVSASLKKPFVHTLFLNPQVMNVSLLNQVLQEKNRTSEFDQHLRLSTRLLALSFFLSSALNFFLAQSIFKPLPLSLDEAARSHVLNQQIAEMTQWSFVVIMLPSLVFMAAILWFLFRGISKLTEQPIQSFIHQ